MEEQMDKIMERFQHLDEVLKLQIKIAIAEGIGIGLNVSKQIMKNYGR